MPAEAAAGSTRSPRKTAALAGSTGPWWLLARRDRWLWAFTALGLGLRLIWIDQPLVDSQAWRQADTAAIARSFYAEGYDLLHPRVEWRGNTPGYVESEFPLYPFAVALVYSLLGGVQEWVGRLISALASVAAGVLLYGLGIRLYGPGWPPRLAALLFFLSPYNVYFGRAFMPEATMLFFSVGALLAFADWAESGGRALFFAAVVAAALAFLVKIPTLYLGFPLVALAWARWGWGFLRRPVLWLFLVLVILPPVLWYTHAHRLFEQTGLTFGIWNRYGYDKWAGSGAGLDYWLLMAQRLGHGVFTPVGLVLAAIGLSCHRRGDRSEMAVIAWLGGLLLYLVLVPEGNRRLEYYQLPLVAPGMLLAGKALGGLLCPRVVAGCWWDQASRRLRPRYRAALAGALVIAVGAWGVAAAESLYRPGNGLYEYYLSCHRAGQLLSASLPVEALLVAGDVDENAGAPFRAQSPTLLYYCNRKGWQVTPDELRPALLDSLAGLGADYLLVAGGFARDNPALLRDLYRRGVTVPSAFPHFWTDAGDFAAARRSVTGLDRHFLLVRLREGLLPARSGL